MAKQMTVFEELCASAALKPPKDPNDQVFLAKLWKSIDGLDDEEWKELSQGAQKWANAAANAKKADKDFPKVPDAPKPESAADEEAGEDESGDAPVAKKATAKKAAAPAAKKAAAAPAKKAAAAPAKKAAAPAAAKKAANGEKPKKSMLRAAREIICKAPHLTVEDIIGKLEGQGYEAAPVTIGTIRSDTRNTLKIAQELGVKLDALDFDK